LVALFSSNGFSYGIEAGSKELNRKYISCRWMHCTSKESRLSVTGCRYFCSQKALHGQPRAASGFANLLCISYNSHSWPSSLSLWQIASEAPAEITPCLGKGVNHAS